MWRTKTDLPAPTYSPTRWWSKWEVIKHLHDTFGNIPSFVEHEDLLPSRLKLQEILNDPPKNRKLQVQLAITVDVGEPFVKSTYRLEGDGPIAVSAYKEIAALRVAISHQYTIPIQMLWQLSCHQTDPISKAGRLYRDLQYNHQ